MIARIGPEAGQDGLGRLCLCIQGGEQLVGNQHPIDRPCRAKVAFCRPQRQIPRTEPHELAGQKMVS